MVDGVVHVAGVPEGDGGHHEGEDPDASIGLLTGSLAEARHTHDRFPLSRGPIAGDAIDAARAMVIAQPRLPMAPQQKTGETPSRDGPFLPSARPKP